MVEPMEAVLWMAICALTLVVRLPLSVQRRSWWEMNVTGQVTAGGGRMRILERGRRADRVVFLTGHVEIHAVSSEM